MNRSLMKVLSDWPHSYIHDADLAIQLSGTDEARYSVIKRAMKEETLNSSSQRPVFDRTSPKVPSARSLRAFVTISPTFICKS